MESSEIAKTAAATISPNCGLKQRELSANLKLKTKAKSKHGNSSVCGNAESSRTSATEETSDKPKYLYVHSRGGSSGEPSSGNGNTNGIGNTNTNTGSRLYRHVTTSEASNSIGENDSATSLSDKKKPLHLQIIEDGTCSSSDYDNRPSSSGSGDNIVHPGPASTCSNSSVPVQVSSEKNEILLGDADTDAANNADIDNNINTNINPTNNDDRIIIQSSSSSSSKCMPIHHLNNKQQPIIKCSDFVPRDDLTRLGALKPSKEPFIPLAAPTAADPTADNNHDKMPNGAGAGVNSSSTNNNNDNNNKNDISCTTKTDLNGVVPNDGLIASSIENGNNNNNDTSTSTMDLRDDSSKSSTPDLTSMTTCAEDVVSAEKTKETTSSKAFRAVSTSSSENGNSPNSTKENNDSEPSNDDDINNDNDNTKENLSIDVASALDQVLAELEDSGISRAKNGRPCILQQSLVGDSGSSGTSTPNEDFLDGKKLEDSNKANSLRVESSMLLPEDSLAVIAQMTIGTGAKKEKKNVVTFGEDSLISVQSSDGKETDAQNAKASPKQTGTNSTMKLNSLVSPSFLKGIDSEIVNTIVPSPVNVVFNKLLPQQNGTQKVMKKIPLISGTAAAQLKVIAEKTSNYSPTSKLSPVEKSCGNSSLSKPLAAPPPLMPGNLISQSKISINNVLSSTNKEKSECKDEEEKVNGSNWEKGMSMLADIIANAAPMRTRSGSSTGSNLQSGSSGSPQNNSKTSNNTMVPVGQSLRLYASIAAQAGISSYTTETPISDPQQQQQQQQLQQPPTHQPQETISKPVTNTCTIPEPISEPKHPVREIGKIRRFNASIDAFGEWEDLPFQTYGDTEPRRWCELNIDESIEIPLRRGGRLRVFPNFLGESRRNIMQNTMENCLLYRQYSVFSDNATTPEPRLQVLLSSQAKEEHNFSNDGVGYRYRGVSMKAKPISMEPQVESLSRDLAELYRLPNQEWNIGANLLYYRDGNDHTTWHSDDTQGEALILCIVVESHAFARPILVKPKTTGGFQDGDEEIIIFVGQGDAYEMDGQMQMNYEHCLPVKQDNINAKRSAIIFRHGNTTPVSLDTGIPLISDATECSEIITEETIPSPKLSTQFGHLDGAIKEGKKLYTKRMLVDIGAHRYEKKYISGSIREGCESILVDSQDRLLREDDGLYWLQISCTKPNGGGALCQSFHKKGCIRVFRSSSLDNKYAPALYEGEEDQVLYRYDGVYTVRAMWDAEGSETESPPTSDEIHTFFLMRQPKRPVDGTAEDGMYYNKISLQELWNEIQKRKGVRKPKDFAVPEPIMEVGRIGDKSNARRRPASSRRVLNNGCNDTTTSSKKKNVNVIPLSKYSTFSGNSSVFRPRSIYSSDSDSDDESESEGEQSMDADEVDEPIHQPTSSTRPRRKSAAVARNYLKEVMHNRYGDMEKSATPHSSSSSDRRKKRSLWSSASHDTCDEDDVQRKAGKRQCQEDSSSDEDEDDLYDGTEQDPENSTEIESQECALEISDETLSTLEEVKSSTVVDASADVEKKKNVDEKQKSDTKKKPAPKRNNNRAKTTEKSILEPKHKEEGGESPEIGDEKLLFAELNKVSIDPSAIKEGHRINVEYRNTLFKATVRKTRMKNDAHEFQIHYDGNKKSNVHWIPFSMVHAVLDEAIVPISPETKPRRGRKRKQPASKSKSPKQPTEEPQPKEEEQEDQKFSNGTEAYAEYKGVLYLSTVRKWRKNRKGEIEYMIHYDGFKKTADRWLKESLLYEINEDTTLRFNEQRGVDQSIAIKKDPEKNTVEFDAMSTRSSKGKPTTTPVEESNGDSNSLDMGDIDSGVEFLPGSCVFVAKTNALYLAKMMKRRKKGRGTEYFVEFDGMSSSHNEWISLSDIYELNPKTRKIYEKTTNNRSMPKDDEEDSESEPEPKLVKKEEVPKASPKVTTRGSKKGKGRAKKPVSSKLYDMQNIEPGVTFLPGSTLFVQWKNGLYLGKMLKKRGKGDHMEYFVHYDGFKSTQDEWVSVSMVFEINPQTKRAFNRQRKKT